MSLTNSHRYDAPTSTLVTHMVLERGTERAERVARHRVMTCREVVDAFGARPASRSSGSTVTSTAARSRSGHRAAW